MNRRVAILLALLLVPLLALSGCSVPIPSLETIATQALLAGAETQPEAATSTAPVTTDASTAPATADTTDSTTASAPAAASAPATADTTTPSAPASAETILDAVEATLEQIYEQVTPSVVNIQVVQTAGSLSFDHPEIPGLPSDPSLPDQPFNQQGLGSGFVWDKEGHIVTNNHVVAGAEEITVTFQDGLTVPGEVLGADPHSELAVIKVQVPADQLQPVVLADSTQVKPGQLAVAIGNPFGLEGTMTVGFISALGRSLPVASGITLGPSYTIPDIIQTDAPINPGNSGGVLVDDGGRVIGVPTAIESPVRANAGIGFAVPSVIVQKVVPALIQDGRYEHPWLGISAISLNSELAEVMDLDPGQRGVLVAEVMAGSPAEVAELQGSARQVELDGQEIQVGGDVIIAIDDQRVDKFEDLVTYLARSVSVGQMVSLTILRDGEEATVEVTPAARPQQEEAQPLPMQEMSARAWLGIQGLTVTSEIAEAMELAADQRGVLIEDVVGDSPAEEAGLRGGSEPLDVNGQRIEVGGDIIVAADDQVVDGLEDLLAFLNGAEPGQEVTLSLLRDGQEVEVAVVLGERPTSIP